MTNIYTQDDHHVREAGIKKRHLFTWDDVRHTIINESAWHICHVVYDSKDRKRARPWRVSRTEPNQRTMARLARFSDAVSYHTTWERAVAAIKRYDPDARLAEQSPMTMAQRSRKPASSRNFA